MSNSVYRGFVMSCEETIRNYIAQNILFSSAGYPYEDGASFLENSIIDSMNVMELVLFLEEQMGVPVADDEIVPDNFDSVVCLANFVRRKQELAA
jgi:acyl carrier protein